MKKEDLIKLLKESNVQNVTNAEQTVANIEAKVVDNGTAISDDKENANKAPEALPTQKDVEKAVNGAVKPLVDADKDGVSKNGGECEKLMTADGIEAEKKKEDKGMKDVINVSARKVDEASEVSNELLAALKEAAKREENYKAKISQITKLCEKALVKQEEVLTREHAAHMNKIFESVIAEGEKLEKELTEAANKNAKLYESANKLYQNSNKLNKILLEAVKKAQPEKQMTRYMTASMRAMSNVK